MTRSPSSGNDHLPSSATGGTGSRRERLAALRRQVARLEQGTAGGASAHLALGLPEIDRDLPGPGLPLGALHEVLAAAHGDRPAALGFVTALAAHTLRLRRGPLVLVASHRCFAEFGRPYGHGLRSLGIALSRVLLVETRNDRDALWAMEEALKPETAPALVIGAIDGRLDLTASRRLNLAAAGAGAPLILLRAPGATGTSAAVTRWRIAAAPSGRDRFGALSGPRWQATLERCRNGRGGHWLLEWDHGANRFHLAEIVADRPAAAGAGEASQGDLRRLG